MRAPAALESYLLDLDQALSRLPVGDKAGIIRSVKKSVLELLKRDRSITVQQALTILGPAEDVAQKFLTETPSPSPKTWLFKGIAWGTLSAFAVALILFGFLLWFFTPLVHIDPHTGNVKILRGLIDVNPGQKGDPTQISIAGKNRYLEFRDDRLIHAGQSFILRFQNGHLVFEKSRANLISWNCSGESSSQIPRPMKSPGTLTLDFQDLNHLNCRLKIPSQTTVFVKGQTGKLRFVEPTYPLTAELKKGEIYILPEPHLHYRYDLKVGSGLVDRFYSSKKDDALDIKATVVNGRISQN